jgi:hypothetical protein
VLGPRGLDSVTLDLLGDLSTYVGGVWGNGALAASILR